MGFGESRAISVTENAFGPTNGKAGAQGRRIVLIFLLGVVATLVVGAGAHMVRAAAVYSMFTDRLAKRDTVRMGPLTVNPSWIVSGTPKFHITGYGEAPDKSAGSGIWECVGPGKFVWKYGVDETIYILEGSVDIEYLGEKFTLHAGDSTHFTQGTDATWTVRDRVKKTFTVYKVDFLSRVVRRLLR